jgi:hypothetical protein
VLNKQKGRIIKTKINEIQNRKNRKKIDESES